MITLLAKYQDLTRLSFVTFAQQNGSSFLNIFLDFLEFGLSFDDQLPSLVCCIPGLSR